MLASLPLFVFPFCMMAAAISDAQRFIIPNTISKILIAGFFVAFAVSGLDLNTLGIHILCGLVALSFGIALFGFKLLGAGDGKLIACAALWLGWPAVIPGLVYITFAGGALSLVIVIVWRLLKYFPALCVKFPFLAVMASKPLRRLPSPYGIAIAIGALAAFPDSDLVKAIMVP